METIDTDTKVYVDENLVCEHCGRYGAFELAGRHVCLECYEQIASCCPEFPGDYLSPLDDG